MREAQHRKRRLDDLLLEELVDGSFIEALQWQIRLPCLLPLSHSRFSSHALCKYPSFNSQLSSSSSPLYVVLFACVLSWVVVVVALFVFNLLLLTIVLSYVIDRAISKHEFCEKPFFLTCILALCTI